MSDAPDLAGAGDAPAGLVVAVPGAGGPLGRSVARTLHAAGARLALAELDPDRLARAAEGLDPDRVHVASPDLTDLAATEAWAADVQERFGGVDAVVHCVGGWRGGAPLHETPPEDVEFLDAALIETVRTVTRAFAPALIASGRGRFVLVSGSTAQAPPAGNAAYAAAKAYAEAWTLAFDAELREHGGAANILVVTMLTEDPGPKKVATHVDDAAAAIAFALSPAAAQMRGRRLPLHP